MAGKSNQRIQILGPTTDGALRSFVTKTKEAEHVVDSSLAMRNHLRCARCILLCLDVSEEPLERKCFAY
jgi:hypothetical protein